MHLHLQDERELEARYLYPKHVIACSLFSKVAIIAPSASLCYGQFCILPTLSFLSLALSYSRSSSRSSSRFALRSSRLLFLSSRAGRKEERGGEISARLFEVFYGFTLRRLRVLPLVPPSFFSRISFTEQITKNVQAKFI